MPETPQPSIRIRMYRVGFGDCFLITFPDARGPAHVLIDCGVHSRGDIGTLQKAAANIEQETAGNLRLLVATHAHQDHISGFGRFSAMFRGFTIGEVWMPWTEDRRNPTAV